MIAIEIMAPIVNHRIDVSSDRLPSHVEQARLIVMYDEACAAPETPDIVTLAHAARESFPRRETRQLRDDVDAMRSEWDKRSHGT